MIELKAPAPYTKTDHEIMLFLGGSIDMGAAENWQERLAKDLSNYTDKQLLLLNPRRDDWDSTWIQDPTPGTKFYEQVDWELNAQEAADGLIYYFAADSKAPITLLELGIYGPDNGTIVCCPKEFYRYGNVKMVCERYNIPMVESYDDLLMFLRVRLDEYYNS